MSGIDPRQPHERSLRGLRELSGTPAFVTVTYLVVAVSWIFLSDLAVARWPVELHWAQTVKGVFFVLVTAVVLGVLLVRRDRQLRRRTQALRASEATHRAVIEAAGEGIALLAPDHRAMFVNPRMREMFRLGDAEEISFLECVTEAHRAMVLEALERVRDGGNFRLGADFRARDGSGLQCELSLAPLLRDSQMPGCVVAMVTDVTERQTAEAERDRVRGQLDESARFASLGRLASAIAHEFNNVLMGILPFVEVIRRAAGEDPKIANATTNITKAVDRGRQITGDILGFARLEKPATARIALDEWLEIVGRDVRGVVGERVTVDVRLDDGSLAVTADAKQLRQALLNLAQSARDAMPSGGELLVFATRVEGDGGFAYGNVPDPGRFVHLTMADTGSEIPKESLPHIFEPLFALKGRGGKGLALPMAHQIATNHGGFLFAESGENGSTFHLFIPRA